MQETAVVQELIPADTNVYVHVWNTTICFLQRNETSSRSGCYEIRHVVHMAALATRVICVPGFVF